MSGAREALTDALQLVEGQDEIVSLVLPVVQALMDEHAAAELEKAADDTDAGRRFGRSDLRADIADYLRARAAALRAATGEGTS